MGLPIIYSVRGVIKASVVVMGLGILVIVNNSKDKGEYDKSSGVIEYFDKEYLSLPTRNKGDYRYLKIDSYPYLFEIYEPNSEETERKIDDLRVGDTIDIYYYEISDTENSGVNRFAQFVDKNHEPYFIRNGFQKKLGFVIIGLSILLNIVTFVLWNKGRLIW